MKGKIMLWKNWLYSVFVLVVCWTASVEAYGCYQCNSTLDNNCQEKWDDRLSTNSEKYKPCYMWDAQYCVKVTGLWGGVVGTHRFCSSRDMGDQCQDIWFPDHDRMYRACVYTCTRDGCNSASGLSAFPAILCAVVWLIVEVVRKI